MLPLRELFKRVRIVKFVRLPSSLGMLPLRVLLLRKRPIKFVRFPSPEGILPLRELSGRSMMVKFVRLPSSEGMLPLRELLARSRYSTCPFEQPIPNQLHSVPAAPNQPVLSVQLAPSVELYSATKASRSFCGTCA